MAAVFDIITNDFSIDYSIYVHDISNKGILNFSYYQKDFIDDQLIYLQYFGKLNKLNISKQHARKFPSTTLFEFSVNNFCNFVNKLDEFYSYNNCKYPRTSYISDKDQVIRLLKLNADDYQISGASTIYLGLDNKVNWTINLNKSQISELLNYLKSMKNKILETIEEKI